MFLLKKIKDTHNGPTVQFPNIATINATNTGILSLSRVLSTHTKRARVFDGLHSFSLIFLGKLCENECIAILDKNGINILRDRKLILKGHRNKIDGLWEITVAIPLRHCDHAIITTEKTKTELIQYFHGCCFRNAPRTFLKAIKQFKLT